MQFQFGWKQAIDQNKIGVFCIDIRAITHRPAMVAKFLEGFLIVGVENSFPERVIWYKAFHPLFQEVCQGCKPYTYEIYYTGWGELSLKFKKHQPNVLGPEWWPDA